jgi:hypothetical protein
MLPRRKLIEAGPAEPCEGGCGCTVRWARYEGGTPRLNEVRNGRDVPGGHTADTCQQQRHRRRSS